jgi:DegV family protein with EDD domain
MLPGELVSRFDVLVVPLTVVVDGRAQLESEVELAEFFARLRAGATVSTAAPSPGEFLAVYREAVAAGAETILSIHVGSNYSATVNAASLAASEAGVPIVVVDTMMASFVAGCCVWRAAEALAEGGSIDAAARCAHEVAAQAGSVFTVGELERARRSGRVKVGEGSGVAVLATAGSEMFELERVVDDLRSAVEAMARHVGAQAGPLRVGIGHADAPIAANVLEGSLRELPQVHETVRYIVGPSVAAHTGVGTFGAVFHQV